MIEMPGRVVLVASAIALLQPDLANGQNAGADPPTPTGVVITRSDEERVEALLITSPYLDDGLPQIAWLDIRPSDVETRTPSEFKLYFARVDCSAAQMSVAGMAFMNSSNEVVASPPIPTANGFQPIGSFTAVAHFCTEMEGAMPPQSDQVAVPEVVAPWAGQLRRARGWPTLD